MKTYNNHSFQPAALLASITLFAAASSQVQTTIFTDNFNVAATASLDGSDQTGRHTGLVANDVLVRSGGVQMAIAGNQLTFKTADPAGRVRFQPVALPANTLYDFAAGTSGTAILGAGGFRFEFDWTPDNNTTFDNWVSLSAGYTAFDQTVRVNNSATDFGLLFRNTGETLFFDNGASAAGNNYDVSGGAFQRHATIDFTFGSFADGSAATANAYIDNVFVGSQNFTWDNNAGALYLELGNIGSVKQLDNISITAVPEPSSLALLGLAGLAALGFRRSKA